MKRLIGLLLPVLILGWIGCAQAETELVQVYQLPLSEAEAAVRSQLSPQGAVSAIYSRNMLIIQDDAASIMRARELLSRLDQPAQQYRTTVEIVRQDNLSQWGVGVSGTLPGGWVTLSLADSRQQGSSSSSYNLAVQANRAGHIEAGEIIPMRASVQSWLARFGIVGDAVSYEPVTGGFDVLVQPLGSSRARVKILPWLKRLRQAPALGQVEIQADQGRQTQAGGRVQVPAGQFGQGSGEKIEVVSAATELDVSLGEEVVIAATSQDAREMAQALLSGRSQSGEQRLLIRLRVEAMP